MADDRLDQAPKPERPVLTGIAALVGVALVVGLVMGGAALAGTRTLGLGGDEAASSTGSGGEGGGETMFLPKPERTEGTDEPLITLAPTPGATQEPGDEAEAEGENKKKKKKQDEDGAISLSAGQNEVSPMGQIDLTGVYPGGEGAILQVQQFSSGSWDDFAAVTASVSNETFSTFVQTGQPGLNRFRVVDTETGETSNEIRVRISGG